MAGRGTLQGGADATVDAALHPAFMSTDALVLPDAPIVVRRARPGDAAAFARVMGQPEVFANLMQLPMPTEESWRQALAEPDSANSGELRLVAEIDGRVVGTSGLHPSPRLRRRHAATLGISVEPAAQGRGVGRALMQAMCDFADGWGQLLRLELTVFTDNQRAIRLYESCGFRIEGTHVGFALRDGVYADVYAMARLHPQPPGIAWPTN